MGLSDLNWTDLKSFHRNNLAGDANCHFLCDLLTVKRIPARLDLFQGSVKDSNGTVSEAAAWGEEKQHKRRQSKTGSEHVDMDSWIKCIKICPTLLTHTVCTQTLSHARSEVAEKKCNYIRTHAVKDTRTRERTRQMHHGKTKGVLAQPL